MFAVSVFRDRKLLDTVNVGLREIRDLEGTHRFCHFLLSKLMCNGHLLNGNLKKLTSVSLGQGFSKPDVNCYL